MDIITGSTMTYSYNVLCATDNAYVPYCGVMLTSLFENNKNISIDVYVLTEGLSEQNVASFQTLAKKYNQNIYIVAVNSDSVKDCPIQNNDYVSIATYYRLLAQEVLPHHIDKILYLDCDMIISSNITELYNTNINDYAIAAVLDEDYTNADKYVKLNYPQKYGYFNAGMLLINLEYWRNKNVMKRCFRYIKTKRVNLTFHDQDTLNAVLHKEKKLLPIKYNLQTGFLYVHNNYSKDFTAEIMDNLDKPTIIHYTGPSKPWYKGSHHPLRNSFLLFKQISLWNKTLLISTKKSFIETLIHYRNIIIWKTGLKKHPKTYIIKDKK